MNNKIKDPSAVALGKKSVRARKEKLGKMFNKHMQRIAKLPRKAQVEP